MRAVLIKHQVRTTTDEQLVEIINMREAGIWVSALSRTYGISRASGQPGSDLPLRLQAVWRGLNDNAADDLKATLFAREVQLDVRY